MAKSDDAEISVMRTVGKELAASLLVAISMLQLYHADVQAGATASTDRQSVSTVNVIFDTDVWGDIDDVLAFAMLHALHDRGEVNLLAVTISTDEKWCAPYVDLVNTFYGHSQVPVGVVRGGPTTETFRELMPDVSWPLTEYTRLIAQRKNSDGSLVHPRRLSEATRLPEAVSLLRGTLAGQPDGSVVMIQVGFSTNLARLLRSPADEHSALGGRDLIRKKVRLLSVMAGVFAPTKFRGTAYTTDRPESNLLFDVPSAKELFSNWPTPLVATGLETG